MQRELIKGNEAAVKGAILAGCTHYFGYPITPASEIAHAAALYFPRVGGVFLQAESEIAAINMVYGAAACGKRTMTASAGPGISLKQEGVSYLAGANLPCVIVNVMRAGPGLGNIWPEQGDYNQAVKGGGHGNYRCLVLAPNSAQEMCDHTMLAFDLAEKYMGPVYVLTDGYVGQMKEPVVYPEEVRRVPHFDWALYGNNEGRKNLCSSIIMSCEGLEKANIELQKRYERMDREEVRFQEHHVDDAELVIVAYGITSRLAYSAVDELRAKGVKVGLLRPITLFPFPTRRIQEIAAAGKAKAFMGVELSNGQMVDDVRLALNGKLPCDFYGRMGGMVPSVEELVGVFQNTHKKYAL